MRSRMVTVKRRVRRALLGACLVGVALLALGRTVHTQSVTTCPEANPYDREPDQFALERCLANFDRILLQPEDGPNYVGYVVADTVDLRRSGVLLTSAQSPMKAVLVAAPSLAVPLLRARANDYEISFIVFDGNRDERDVRDKYCTEARNYRNVELNNGTGFRIRYVESKRAVCGSGMTVGGSRQFEIVNSWFYDNGRQPEDANDIAGLWADGLNVFNCTGATIRDNTFWDNTDVDLGVNGGPGCSVYRNKITHFNRYAFAGLVAGDPTRSGGEFSENEVVSAPDRLAFGIVVGCHPWFECGNGYASDLWVHDNKVEGAVINLVVDGVTGGTIERNVIGRAKGTRIMNCLEPAEYLIAHVIDVRLQPGYVVRPTDFVTSCPSTSPEGGDRVGRAPTVPAPSVPIRAPEPDALGIR